MTDSQKAKKLDVPISAISNACQSADRQAGAAGFGSDFERLFVEIHLRAACREHQLDSNAVHSRRGMHPNARECTLSAFGARLSALAPTTRTIRPGHESKLDEAMRPDRDSIFRRGNETKKLRILSMNLVSEL